MLGPLSFGVVDGMDQRHFEGGGGGMSGMGLDWIGLDVLELIANSPGRLAAASEKPESVSGWSGRGRRKSVDSARRGH